MFVSKIIIGAVMNVLKNSCTPFWVVSKGANFTYLTILTIFTIVSLLSHKRAYPLYYPCPKSLGACAWQDVYILKRHFWISTDILLNSSRDKNDLRNSGGTLRQKFKFNDIWNLIFDIWHYTFDQWTIGTLEHWNQWTFDIQLAYCDINSIDTV